MPFPSVNGRQEWQHWHVEHGRDVVVGWKGYCYQRQCHCHCDGHFHVVGFVDDGQKVAVAGFVVDAVVVAGVVVDTAVVAAAAVDTVVDAAAAAGIAVVAAAAADGGTWLVFEIVEVDEHDSEHERLRQEVRAVASSWVW